MPFFRSNPLASFKDSPLPEKTERLIIVPLRGEDGLFVEPPLGKTNEERAEREKYEEQNRTMFSRVFDFGDSAHNPETWDPSGDHACGDCNKQSDIVRASGCVLINITINKKCGSCRRYENKKGRAFDFEVLTAENPGTMTPHLASYGVSKKAFEAESKGESTDGLVFGCRNCPFGVSSALGPDSAGRGIHCRQGDFRVRPNECCAINGAETI